ncbi:hypothetical protein GCM10023158_10880 [Gluconacetobacter tumulicola]
MLRFLVGGLFFKYCLSGRMARFWALCGHFFVTKQVPERCGPFRVVVPDVKNSDNTGRERFMPETEDHAPQTSLRDVFQLMGAILFVMGMILVGWRAAFFSGVWPA